MTRTRALVAPKQTGKSTMPAMVLHHLDMERNTAAPFRSPMQDSFPVSGTKKTCLPFGKQVGAGKLAAQFLIPLSRAIRIRVLLRGRSRLGVLPRSRTDWTGQRADEHRRAR